VSWFYEADASTYIHIAASRSPLTPFILRRDRKGRVVKENDHALDTCRYFVMSGIHIAVPRPQTQWSQRRTRRLISYDPMHEMWKRR
jgi:hypothetical protein